MDMLGNSMRKYVNSENKNGYSKAVQAVYNSRIRTYAKQAIQDLALLAERLPEEQQAEIFTDINLRPLIRALLRISPQQTTEMMQNKALKRQKQLRLEPIAQELIYDLNNSNLSWLIAPIGARYLRKEHDYLANLKAIHYKGLERKGEEE